jgi:hypothetical protein
MWRSVRPNFVGNIPVGCPSLGVQEATVRLWSTLTKSPSPPVGRYLDCHWAFARRESGIRVAHLGGAEMGLTAGRKL